MPCAILTSAIIEHTATGARHSQTTAGRDEGTARQFDGDDDASTRSPESECKYLHHSKKVILTIYRTNHCTAATTRPVKVTTKVEQEALYSSKPARFGGTQHPIQQGGRPCLLDRAQPRASNNTHGGATASTEASREASAGASAGTGTSTGASTEASREASAGASAGAPTGASTGASAARQNEPGAAAAQRETASSCAYGPAAAVKRPSKDDELQRQQDMLPAHIKRRYQVSCMTAYGASCADLRR